MDLKKVLDQTVRELKREVNKKVLKVPEIEQKHVLLRLRNDSEERSLDPVKNWEPLFLKLGRVADFVESVGNFAVLEATSNEPWGPHGTLMADIAQATRNFNEYQMIMSILWKRLNDSGKNWRHVYKALTVLEFLVANGAERIIDDFSEHAYQVQTLVDFQFIEPNGKDQGINVRKKAQTLVALVNDKEKVREVRHKAASNRDKYRGVSSTGSIHKPSSYSSTGGGYSGDQDEERVASNSHYGGRDDDKYGAGRDKDSDRYKEDDQRGRDGQPSKDEEWSTDHERNGEYSFGQKVIDQSYNRYSGGKHDGARKDELFDDDNHVAQQGEGRLSKARVDVPPTYEDTVLGHGSGHGRPDNTRDGGGSAAVLSQSGALGAKSQSTSAKALSTSDAGSSFFSTKLDEDLDDFDPRGIFLSSAAPTPQLDGSSFRQMQSVDSSSDSGVTAKVGGVEELFSDASFLTGSTGALSYSTPSAALGTPQAPGSQTSNTHTVGDLFTVTRGTSMLAAPDIVAFSSRDVFGSASGGEYVASVGLQLPAVVPDNSNLGSYAGASPFGGPGFTAQNSRSGGPMTGSTLSTPQLPSGYEVTAPSRPTAKKEPFAQRGMWADTLSTGLVDLDIKGPKNYPLAELGIELGSTYTFAERRKDDKSMSASMGKAMGSGSGLGLAAASNLVPPQGPGTGIGAGSGPGFSYGMGIGMRMSRGQQGVQGLAMPSGMDAGVTFGPGMGASFMGGDPPMRNGSGLPMAQGMGIVSSLGMGYGTGYSNQPR